MSQQSAIEWTATVHPDGSVTPGATWNPVRGCVKVSPGCANCYAETFAERFRGVKGHPYEQGFDLRLVPEKLTEPLSWKKPRRVFVNSMSDLFQDGVPDAFIDQVFAVMALCPQHTFQILTKRADRMRAYMQSRSKSASFWKSACPEGYAMDFQGISLLPFPLPNVWLGVSVENQHFADERIPLLLQTPAAVRFISAEPLLGPIDLRFPSRRDVPHVELDWVIVGGESGHGARPFEVAWARSIVQQCHAAGVACFVKQLGANVHGLPLCWSCGGTGEAMLSKETGRGYGVCDCKDGYQQIFDRKGGDPSEWPEDLRVREFPRG